MENYKKGIDSLVFAVTGSGKTEIVLSIISKTIESGGRVGFVIPRRDVVIEIGERLKHIFKENKVVEVYGGHTEELEGDIICLTSHQLYRYHHYFDLVVFDEIDAFPYKNNDTLNSLFLNSIKGHYIQMSATPSERVIDYFKKEGRDILHLDIRYHRNPLPVPKVIKKGTISGFIYLLQLLKRFEKNHKPVFLFCPTIEECERVYQILKHILKEVNYVHSKKMDRDKVIKDFKKSLIQTMITTSVLERGVTVKNLQVIIFKADHFVYDSATLIQISGRVGRKIGATHGEVMFICHEETDEIRKCIREIQASNQVLQDMLREDRG